VAVLEDLDSTVLGSPFLHAQHIYNLQISCNLCSMIL
jgi:hypothetical protein